MRIDTRPRHKNSPRPAEKNCPQFLQWLRGRECLALQPNCEGKIEAAHVDYAGDKGMGSKASDRFAIPLCRYHHHRQHILGWTTFERAHLMCEGHALVAAQAYWQAWPGRIAWERKIEANK